MTRPQSRADDPDSRDLGPTSIIDCDHQQVVSFARHHCCPDQGPREKVAALDLAVRDLVAYNPYRVRLEPAAMNASQTLAQGHGWCVPRAALLAVGCRAQGIPARVGYADMRNHLSTRRLREVLGTYVYHWHSYTAIHLARRCSDAGARNQHAFFSAYLTVNRKRFRRSIRSAGIQGGPARADA